MAFAVCTGPACEEQRSDPWLPSSWIIYCIYCFPSAISWEKAVKKYSIPRRSASGLNREGIWTRKLMDSSRPSSLCAPFSGIQIRLARRCDPALYRNWDPLISTHHCPAPTREARFCQARFVQDILGSFSADNPLHMDDFSRTEARSRRESSNGTMTSDVAGPGHGQLPHVQRCLREVEAVDRRIIGAMPSAPTCEFIVRTT